MVWSDEWESMKLYAMGWDFYALVWEFNAMLWDSNTVLTYGVCCKIYARSDCNWFFLNALTQSVKNLKKKWKKKYYCTNSESYWWNFLFSCIQ